MKRIIRNILVNCFCFWLISSIIPAIDYSRNFVVLFYASLTLSLVNFLVKPLLNILFLPLNLITLGTFRWVTNIIVLYLVTVLIPEFSITPFHFAGYSSAGFILPPLYFNLFFTYLLIAFLFSVISDIIYSLFK